MAYWGEQVNTPGAPNGDVYLRDYAHAAKIFRPNGYQYSPKFKFLFHVYFDINQDVYPIGLGTGANFGLAVKTARLPSYTFSTSTLNQYNRKRIVQTKVQYEPIDITFHDDNGNLIRNLLYYYFLYYYNDSNKPYVNIAGLQKSPQDLTQLQAGTLSINNATTGLGYNNRNIYNNSITGDVDWGYIGEGLTPTSATNASIGYTKTPFFKNITIYGFNQHNFVGYTLINPIIKSFSHDTYNYSEIAGTMEHSMQVEYETVKYFQGALDGKKPSDVVTGFGMEQYYDTEISPIAKEGSTSQNLGQGSLVPSNGGYATDLATNNPAKATQSASIAYNTTLNQNLAQTPDIALDASLAQASNINTPNRNLNFDFPIYGATPSAIGTAGSNNGLPQAPATINTATGLPGV